MRTIRKTIFPLALAVAFLFASVAPADDTAPAPPAPAATETSDDAGVAPVLPSKLQIHGYLTQGYARAEQHQFLGITTDGTSEYRTAALQFRYAMTRSDSFVLQLAHEKRGETVLASEEIELDWGYYERRFGENTRVKIGRVQVPFGIYNEIRDVGTILPFFRLPFGYYGEGGYETEALDGVVATHRFAADSPWNVEASAYYGGWDAVERRDTAVKGKVSDALGGQLWLSTPVDGLRFGIGGLRMTASKGFLPPGVTHDRHTLHGSIDGSFAKWMVKGEYRRTDMGGGEKDRAMYAQVGYRVLPRLMLVLQGDRQKVHLPEIPPFVAEGDYLIGRDYAFAVDYFFRPDVVLKIETHRNRNVNIEDAYQDLINTPRADYTIVSLSVSF